jgi:alginate O-acetyltransferase complex protein AlgI
MLLTFGLTVFAWIFFRAENIGHAFSYISEILSISLFEIPEFSDMQKAMTTIILILIFLLVEWQGREEQYAIAHLGIKWKRPLRYMLYYSIIIAILWFGGKEQQFIYFQF